MWPLAQAGLFSANSSYVFNMKIISKSAHLALSLLFMALVACDRGELPIEPYDRGGVKLKQFDMGETYDLTAYFDLGSNTFVKTLYKYDWELAFDCSDSLEFVYLNSGLYMRSVLLDDTSFAKAYNPKEYELRPDHYLHVIDSMPLKGLVNSNRVAIIDLGVDNLGEPRGFRKIKVQYADGQYTLLFGNVNAETPQRLTIEKNGDYNTSQVNLQLGVQSQLEPPKNEYDLFFTQYTHMFYEPYTPYLVNGVLLNPHETLVGVENEIPFEDINLEMARAMSLNKKRDGVGYDWKYYNLEEGTYIIDTERTYIIKDSEGFYYKIRFVDFYAEDGVKGAPTFEYQQL